MIPCPYCDEMFEDEHGHGLCFACKIQGITWGSVRQGPSVYALEKETVEAAKASGRKIERAHPNDSQDIARARKHARKMRELEDKKIFDKKRRELAGA